MKMISKKKKPKHFLKEIIHHKLLNYLTKNAASLNKSPNLAIYSKDFIGFNIILDGVYEAELLELLMNFFKENNIDLKNAHLLDIGANIGNHTVFFSSYFKSITSFEPNPKLFTLLQVNTAQLKNVSIFNYGISDYKGDAVLYYSDDNLGEGSINNSTNKTNSAVIKLTTLDELNFDHKIDVVKIDIEGHEYEALLGGILFIEKNRPLILFEQNKSEIHKGTTKTIELLKSYNYESFYTIARKEYASISRLNILAKLILGSTYEIRPITSLEYIDHSMIIAVPKDYKNKQPF